jgi:hypothetical protein
MTLNVGGLDEISPQIDLAGAKEMPGDLPEPPALMGLALRSPDAASDRFPNCRVKARVCWNGP